MTQLKGISPITPLLFIFIYQLFININTEIRKWQVSAPVIAFLYFFKNI